MYKSGKVVQNLVDYYWIYLGLLGGKKTSYTSAAGALLISPCLYTINFSVLTILFHTFSDFLTLLNSKFSPASTAPITTKIGSRKV